MSVHKTPEGTWRVRYYGAAGKQISKTFKSKVDADTMDRIVKEVKESTRTQAAITEAFKLVLAVGRDRRRR